VAAPRGAETHDPEALDEIDLYGELIIAASAAREERLTKARIDEVLRVGRPGEEPRVPSPRGATTGG
jgi:hypothetical protein